LSPPPFAASSPIRAEIAATFGLAWPMVLTNLAQVGMTTTDLMFLGRLGPQALAAGVLGLNLYFPFFVFAIGYLSAIAPMASRALGARTHAVRAVRDATRQGLWASLALSALSLMVLANSAPMLRALGQDEALIPEAARYLRFLMWALPLQMVYVTLRSVFAALEKPFPALAAICVGLIVNVVANWAFIFGHLGAPALGVAGSGLATAVASAFMLVVIVAFALLDPRARRFRLFGRLWAWRPNALLALARLGTPIGLTMLFESAAFNAAVFIMGRIGEATLAAHAVAIQVATITFMLSVGFSQAASVRVGRFFGARDWPALRRAGWTAWALGALGMGLCGVFIALAPRALIAAFVDVADPVNAEMVRYATSFLLVAAAFQVLDATQSVGSGMLRGLHDTAWPMLFTLLGYWALGLPLGAWLAFSVGLGGLGVWIGFFAALVVIAAAMLARWRALSRPPA
jgi:MATE family multidrug resistance protein